MNADLKTLARRRGQRARIAAARLNAVMALYQRSPQGWLRAKAAILTRQVNYHLRQAHALGRIIERQEGRWRQP
ncbi:MAG: hypothetical protein HYS20_13625 [Rhodocyclales bacterium]|nr:hypothetical protein [Rhodocyclales bacterium]